MMKKWFLIILLCVVSSPISAWANGETLYVRPAGGSYGSENGTSYANAWDGFLNIVYNAANTAGQVDPGDKLYVCGTHTTQQLEIYQDGTASLPIEFDFGCPGDPGIINSGTTNNFALYTEASYINIHHGTFTGGIIFPITLNTSGGIQTADAFIEFHHNTISNCRVYPNPCLDAYGNNIEIHHNTFSDGQASGIVAQGGRSFYIHDNIISDMSKGGDGDDIQTTNIVEGALIENNVIDHSTRDTKYCIQTGSGTAGFSRVIGNTCLRRSTDVVGPGMRANTATVFRGNIVTGGLYGLQCAVGSGVQCDFIGNVIINPSGVGIITGGTTTVGRVLNNTIVGATECVHHDANAAGILVQNNICQGQTTGINKAVAGGLPVDRYNLFYNISGNNVVVDGTPTTPGTGSLLATNPLLTSTYQTEALSPARTAGHMWSLVECLDPRGYPCGIPPDIGAYQEGTYPRLQRHCANIQDFCE